MGSPVGCGWRSVSSRTESKWLSCHWSGERVVNDLQHTTLALTWSDGRSDRPDPINRLIPSCLIKHVYFLLNVLSNLLLRNNAQPFILWVLEGVSWVSIVLRGKDFWTLLDRVIKTRIWQRLEILLLIWVYWYCISVSVKANRFPPWFISFSSWTPWWVMEHRTNAKHLIDMASFSNKKNSNLILTN